MLILGIETTAKAASAALCRNGELVALSFQRSGLTHSRTLLPMTEALLQNAELKLADVDCVAVARGPGSFTGVRIGVATVKGLCWAAEKSAVGVSTLEAMAYLAADAPEGALICPAMDARRGQLYAALFENVGGQPRRLCDDRALAADAMAAEIAQSGRRAYVLGDGWALLTAALRERGAAYILAPELTRWQNAWGVCLAARDKTPESAEALLPTYLRLSQAERERQARME